MLVRNLLMVLMVLPIRTMGMEWNVMEMNEAAGNDVLLSCGEAELFLDGPGAFITWFKETEKETPHGVTSVSRVLYHYPNAETLKNPRRFPIFCNSEDPCQNDTALVLKSITPEDGGLYRCRVQYETIPAEDYYVRLEVDDHRNEYKSIPSKRQRYLYKFADPALQFSVFYNGRKRYYESGGLPLQVIGGTMNLTCEVDAESPSGFGRYVSYWKKNDQNLCSHQHVLQFVICTQTKYHGYYQSILTITNITEDLVKEPFDCIAELQIKEPVRQRKWSISIPLHRPPNHVRILTDLRLTLHQSYMLECLIMGSTAKPTVKWYFDGRPSPYNDTIQEYNSSAYISRIALNSTDIEGYENISCSASNPLVPSQKPLDDTTDLIVGFLPECNQKYRQKLGLLEDEPYEINCTMKAQPEPFQFDWFITSYFHTHSNEVKSLDQYNKLYYTVLKGQFNSTVYGRILKCHASNKFGESKTPCEYEIAIASTPEMPTCKYKNFNNITNGSKFSGRLTCIPGWNGGFPTKIRNIVYNEWGHLIINETMAEDHILDMPTQVVVSSIEIWAYNRLGSSETLRIEINPIKTIPTENYDVSNTPSYPTMKYRLTVIVASVGGTIFCIAVFVIIFYRRWFGNSGETIEAVTETAMPVFKRNEGSFHREPDVEEETSTTLWHRGTTNITVNQLANCNVESAKCRVIVSSVPSNSSVPERTQYYI